MKADYVDQFSFVPKPEANLVLINFGQVAPIIEDTENGLEITAGQTHYIASLLLPAALVGQLVSQLGKLVETIDTKTEA
jgi:hypothetical protein